MGNQCAPVRLGRLPSFKLPDALLFRGQRLTFAGATIDRLTSLTDKPSSRTIRTISRVRNAQGDTPAPANLHTEAIGEN